LKTAVQFATQAISHAQTWLQYALQQGQPALEAGARRFALTLGRALALALLAEHAQWSLDVEGDRRGVTAVHRFAQSPINLITPAENLHDLYALANDLS